MFARALILALLSLCLGLPSSVVQAATGTTFVRPDQNPKFFMNDDQLRAAIPDMDPSLARRTEFMKYISYPKMRDVIAQWLKAEGHSSSVENVVIEPLIDVTKIIDDMKDAITSLWVPSGNIKDEMLIKFFWNSSEVTNSRFGGIAVVCRLTVDYSGTYIQLTECYYIRKRMEDIGWLEWARGAKENEVASIQEVSTKYDLQRAPVIYFDQVFKTEGDLNFANCDSEKLKDFEILVVTGSEKKEFLNSALDSFMARRKNFTSNKCFGVRIVSMGSVEAATAYKKDKLKRIVRGDDGQEKVVYPQLWTPASGIYEKYAFGNNPKSHYDDGGSIVISPLVFYLRTFHREKIASYEQQGTMPGFTGLKPYDGQNLFSTDPTILGFIEALFRQDQKDKGAYFHPGKLGRRVPRYNFVSAPASTSNSGLLFQVISSLEYFTSRLAPDKAVNASELLYDIPESEIESEDYQKFIEAVAERTRSDKRSTNDIGKEFMSNDAVDGVFVYENVAIATHLQIPSSVRPDYYVTYPINNANSNNPAYILKQNSSREQIEAANLFLQHLRSAEMQLLAARGFGFRPLIDSLDDASLAQIDEAFASLTDFGIQSDLRGQANLSFVGAPDGAIVRKIIDTVSCLNMSARDREESDICNTLH